MSGEPVELKIPEVDGRRIDVRVAGTFTTRPGLPRGGYDLLYAGNNPFKEVFGRDVQLEWAPGGDKTLVDRAGRAAIIRESGRPTGFEQDTWTVLAQDEQTARTLCTAVVRVCWNDAVNMLKEEQKTCDDLSGRRAAAQQRIAVLESQLAQAEPEGHRAGVASMTDEAIESAVARFDQEQRLNNIDLAGLKASLESVKQRYDSADKAKTAGPILETLARLQVELEVQLVGKLARREALTRELQQLESGRAARRKENDARRELVDTKKALEQGQKEIESEEKWLRFCERAVNLKVVDGQAVISPVRATNP